MMDADCFPDDVLRGFAPTTPPSNDNLDIIPLVAAHDGGVGDDRGQGMSPAMPPVDAPSSTDGCTATAGAAGGAEGFFKALLGGADGAGSVPLSLLRTEQDKFERLKHEHVDVCRQQQAAEARCAQLEDALQTQEKKFEKRASLAHDKLQSERAKVRNLQEAHRELSRLYAELEAGAGAAGDGGLTTASTTGDEEAEEGAAAATPTSPSIAGVDALREELEERTAGAARLAQQNKVLEARVAQLETANARRAGPKGPPPKLEIVGRDNSRGEREAQEERACTLSVFRVEQQKVKSLGQQVRQWEQRHAALEDKLTAAAQAATEHRQEEVELRKERDAAVRRADDLSTEIEQLRRTLGAGSSIPATPTPPPSLPLPSSSGDSNRASSTFPADARSASLRFAAEIEKHLAEKKRALAQLEAEKRATAKLQASVDSLRFHVRDLERNVGDGRRVVHTTRDSLKASLDLVAAKDAEVRVLHSKLADVPQKMRATAVRVMREERERSEREVMAREDLLAHAAVGYRRVVRERAEGPRIVEDAMRRLEREREALQKQLHAAKEDLARLRSRQSLREGAFGGGYSEDDLVHTVVMQDHDLEVYERKILEQQRDIDGLKLQVREDKQYYQKTVLPSKEWLIDLHDKMIHIAESFAGDDFARHAPTHDNTPTNLRSAVELDLAAIQGLVSICVQPHTFTTPAVLDVVAYMRRLVGSANEEAYVQKLLNHHAIAVNTMRMRHGHTCSRDGAGEILRRSASHKATVTATAHEGIAAADPRRHSTPAACLRPEKPPTAPPPAHGGSVIPCGSTSMAPTASSIHGLSNSMIPAPKPAKCIRLLSTTRPERPRPSFGRSVNQQQQLQRPRKASRGGITGAGGGGGGLTPATPELLVLPDLTDDWIGVRTRRGRRRTVGDAGDSLKVYTRCDIHGGTLPSPTHIDDFRFPRLFDAMNEMTAVQHTTTTVLDPPRLK